MNKQELIKQLKEMQVLMDKSFDDDKLTGRYNEEAANRSHNAYSYAIMVSEQLDEPSREECEIFGLSGCEVECLNCNHIFTAETLTFDEEYVPPDDGYESYTANYCPNCGAKIRKEKVYERKHRAV